MSVFPPFTPFQEFMIAVYTQKIEDVLRFLDDPTFDYKQENNQLFRELHCGRLALSDTMRVYEKLKEHGYVMTDKDIACLAHAE